MSIPVFAQTTVSTTTTPVSMTECGPAETFQVTVTTATTISGVTVEVELPLGVEYSTGSVLNAQVNASNPRIPVFTLLVTPTPSNPVTMEFQAFAKCGFVDPSLPTNATNLTTARYTENASPASVTELNPTPYGRLAPVLTVTSIVPQTITGNVGDTVARQIRVTNQGLGTVGGLTGSGTLGRFKLVDTHGSFVTINCPPTIVLSQSTVSASVFSCTAATGTIEVELPQRAHQGDYVTIEQLVEITDCDLNDQSADDSTLDLSWGCGASTCETTTADAEVKPPITPPTLTITPTVPLDMCFDDGNLTTQQLRIENTATVPALDVKLDIGDLQNSYTYASAGTFEFKVGTGAWASIPSCGTQTTPACLDSVGHGGPCGGVNSADLRIPRIDKQSTVYVRWEAETCLPPGGTAQCGDAFYRNWWRGTARHAQHQCTTTESSQTFDMRATGKAATNVDQFHEGPTDAAKDAVVDLAFVNTAFVLWQGEPGEYLNAKFRIDQGLFALPQQVACSPCSHQNSTIYLLDADGTTKYYPDEITLDSGSNDGLGTTELTAKFGFANFPDSQLPAWELAMKKSEFRITAKTKCFAPPSSLVRLELTHHLSNTCTSTAGVPLVCTEAAVDVHCPGCQRQGILTEDFTLERATFGVADNENNVTLVQVPDGVADDGNGDGIPDGILDDAVIKKQRASVGDEIIGILEGVVNVNANYHPFPLTGTNGPFDLKYGYYRQTFLNNGDKLTELDGQIEIWDWSAGDQGPNAPPSVTCSVPAVRGTSTSPVIIDYEFSPSELVALATCDNPVPAKFDNLDYIRFTTRFKVTDSVPLYTVDVSKVRNHIFLGGLPHTPSAPLIDPQPDCDLTVCDETVQYFCERWTGQIGLVGYQPQTAPFPLTRVFGRDNGSCETELAQFDLFSIGDPRTDNTNFFPGESRGYLGGGLVHDIVIPQGFTFVPGSGRITSLRSEGTNRDHLESIDVSVPGSVTGNTLTFDLSPHLTEDTRFTGDNDSTLYEGDETQHIRNYFTIAPSAPSCMAPTGPQPLALHADVSYAPIVEWPNGSGNWLMDTTLDYPGSTVLNGNFRFRAPDLKVLDDLAPGKTNEVCWETGILNDAPDSDAGYVWFDAYSPSGHVVVTRVKNLTTLQQISPDALSGLYHLDEIETLQSVPLEICATYSCLPNDTIEVSTGWDCEAYPPDLAAYPCAPTTGTLTVQPEVAEMQVAVTAPPSAALCDVTAPPYKIVVDAAGGGRLYDNKVLLELPPGLEFEPASAEIDYPYDPNSPTPVSFANPQPHPILARTWFWEQDLAAVIGPAGLPGDSTFSSQFALTFRLRPDCDFSPRTRVGIDVESRNNCGDLLTAGSEHPLAIDGFPDSQHSVSLQAPDFGSCEATGTVTVLLTNTGSLNTGTDDFIKVLVPAGITYVASSFVGGLNAPPNPVPTQTIVGPDIELSWQLPSGVAPSDVIGFSFDIARDDTYTCGPFTVEAETTATGTAPCVTGGGGDCLLEGVTGRDSLTVSTAPPVLLGVPGDIAIECDQDPAPANPTGECEKVAVNYAESRDDGSCPDQYLLYREWTATDPCGMSTVGEQIVSVGDTRPPMLDCFDQVVDADANGTAPASRVTLPSAFDACDSGPIVVCDNPDPFLVGVTQVQCSATDRCGNQAQCLFDVTVIGVNPIPPVRDLLPSRADPGGSVIDLMWDVDSCPAQDYHLIYGDLSDVSAYSPTGGRCGLGTSGTASWLGVASGNLWFLVIANDDAETEGSWGEATAGIRKAGVPSDQCGSTTRDDSGNCP